MYCELIDFDREHKYNRDRDSVIMNARKIIKENNATHYEIYILCKNDLHVSEYKPFVLQWSHLLETSWNECDKILENIPINMNSESIIEPFSTKKIKYVKLIQKCWRRARYNPDYYMCRNWCKQIQSLYYK
jgi:hypothetical protein